jgi:hypothetical protein
MASIKKMPSKREERHALQLFRMRTANIFVISYLMFIFASIVVGGLSLFIPMNGGPEKVKDLILTISGIFSGPLGLIIGYFYRNHAEEK